MANKRLPNLLLIFTLVVSLPVSAFSQMKISSTPGAPNQGAMLEVESSSRGFLPPRVYLTGAYMMLNGIMPTEGTLIFSTNFTGEGNLGGLFVWKDAKWVSFDESSRILASHITLRRNTNQSLVAGYNAIRWQTALNVTQPSGDSPMWSSGDPAKVIIRRKGLYFISGSCRMEQAVVGLLRYLAITQNGQQVTAIAFTNPGGANGSSTRMTMNTSTSILCEVGDEISLVTYSANTTPVVVPGGLETTRMSVTQIANRTY